MSHKISRRTVLLAGSAGSAAFAALAWATPASSIRVGCQANGFPLKPGDFPALLKALESMKSLGYTGFECNYRLVEGEFGRAAAAREQIERTGVTFIGAHAGMDVVGGQQGARLAAGVAALGADCIVMSSTGLSPEGRFEQSALLQKAKEIEKIARFLRENGLRLAYHNHNPEFANHNAEIDGLAENTSPELVHFLMDAGHGYLGGGDPAAFAARHSKRIYGVHLKTFKGKEVSGQVPLGQGDFDFAALAAAVKKTGWSGWLITEEGGGPKPGNTAALGGDREYIRKLFGA
jgi:sugar phosphate isomerase/epimerase